MALNIVEVSARERVIFTNKALEKMNHHGLYQQDILATLRYGEPTELFKIYSPPLQQYRYKLKVDKEVNVVFGEKRNTIDEIIVINCWVRKLTF